MDRILAHAVVLDKDDIEITTYFVKWKKLPYDEATWEREDDIKVLLNIIQTFFSD